MSSKNKLKIQPELIRVAVARPVFGAFTYHAPDHLIPALSIGVRVLVPFRNQQAVGYVLGYETGPVSFEPKEIREVLDPAPLFPEELVALFEWVADYYHHPLGDVIQKALPGGLNPNTTARWTITEAGLAKLQSGHADQSERCIMGALTNQSLTTRKLGEQLSPMGVEGPLRSLLKKEWIERITPVPKAMQPRTDRIVHLVDSIVSTPKLSAVKGRLLDHVAGHQPISLKDLKAVSPYAPRHIKDLRKMGLVRVEAVPVYQDALGQTVMPDQAPPLTPEQKTAVETLNQAISKGFEAILLAGVTGSGKTEVYLQAAAQVLAAGSTVLILVPEIALLSQMEGCFRARFGPRVALVHSALTKRERYDQWLRIAAGKASIVIGARSAIFAPLKNLGLVIVDEEHDTSYKQEHGLRYNARDLAVVRAKMCGCVAVLGSATPEIQSWHNVQVGKYGLLQLTKRVGDRPLPRIKIVDLRKSRDLRGVRRFLSPTLIEAMSETLAAKQQALLFLNRRGYANLPVCAWCGAPVRCRHCDISLTLHRQMNAFVCHYCSHTRPANTPCQECGSEEIRMLGLGTEKVAEAVGALFPEARVTRMDRDTTAPKGALVKMLTDLRQRRTDVLVGTQMVAKGHDFPGITLVGIVCADLSMNFPDFRAEERTFQLVAQVAGRAGRGQKPGRVILQTYNPRQITLLTAQQQRFEDFYDHDIKQRKALGYPPFARLIRILVAGTDQTATARHVRRLGVLCKKMVSEDKAYQGLIWVLGPVESALFRVANRYRWQILLKCGRADMLRRFIKSFLNDSRVRRMPRGVSLKWDIDPYNVM